MTERKEEPVCPEKRRLLVLYQQATEVYSQAVSELTRRIGTTSKIQYDELYQISVEAELTARTARKRLEAHIAEHGC